MNFLAIDFETANTANQSICAVGLAVFENNQLADTFYSLVRPPKGYGWFRSDWITGCHGICHTDVYNAPEFSAIAPEIFTRLAAADVVIAHKADFDMEKLRGTATHFGLSCPAFDYLCTLGLGRRVWPDLKCYSLDALAAHIGHTFEHHNALADAEACGRILLAMMTHKNMATPRELAAALGVQSNSMEIRACAQKSLADNADGVTIALNQMREALSLPTENPAPAPDGLRP